jgi:hypothetical protein
MPTPDELVLSLARLIESHINHVTQLIGPEAEAAPGSPADAEQRNAETRTDGQPWGDLPPHSAMHLGKLKLTAANDHLWSLCKLMTPVYPLYGMAVMTRSSLEASALAYWLLDPALSVRGRVERELGDRRKSATEERKAWKKLDPQWKEPSDFLGDLAKEAAELGVEPVEPSAMTTLVGELLADYEETRDKGEGVYKYLCAIAHTTTYGVLQHFEKISDAKDQRSAIVRGSLSLGAVWWFTSKALAGHASAMDRLVEHLGLDRWAWEHWKQKVDYDLGVVSGILLHGGDGPVGRMPEPEDAP